MRQSEGRNREDEKKIKKLEAKLNNYNREIQKLKKKNSKCKYLLTKTCRSSKIGQ